MSNIDQAVVSVDANLLAVVLGGTESLLRVELANGFYFEKINLVDSPFRDKYLDSKGQPFDKYCFCQMQPTLDGEVNFICITKRESLPCPIKAFSLAEMHTSNTLHLIAEEWQLMQTLYIEKILSILRIYKEGNIEIEGTHYFYTGQYMANIKTLKGNCINAESQNVFNNFYNLSESEVTEINNIINQDSYDIEFLSNAIDKFELGCTVSRDELAFKELITVGEVLFLNYNSNDNDAKKAKLANRLSAWIYTNETEVQEIHNNIVDFYKYRSDDTHEAINNNITAEARKKLREYIRVALKKYLSRVALQKSNNQSLTFGELRKSIVIQLKETVQALRDAGFLA